MTGRLRLGKDVDVHPAHGQDAAHAIAAMPTITVIGRQADLNEVHTTETRFT